jgi:hypothetical protein
MKTNRFDEILRRKLESIKPDFQDQDWDKWQAFRQHATPTFWQTYGHWLGYAVAALTTAVMVVLYIHQSEQNQDLLKEMQELKQQITASSQEDQVALDSASTGRLDLNAQPSTKPFNLASTDTIYIVERQTVYLERQSETEATEKPANRRIVLETGKIPAIPEMKNAVENLPNQEIFLSSGKTPFPGPKTTPDENGTVDPPEASSAAKTQAGLTEPNSLRGTRNLKTSPDSSLAGSQVPISPAITEAGTPKGNKPHDSERLDLGVIDPLLTPTYSQPATDFYRSLQSRMPRPARAVTADQRIVQTKIPVVANQIPEVPSSVQKVEKIAKDKRLLPDFGLGLPYRVGVGQHWAGRTKASGLWSEVLLGKNWSVQAGLSFQKLEDQKFYNDRIFREKTHEDFRNEHAKPLPQSFDIFNITVGTALTRIPLNLTYRTEIGHNFALFAGAGTQLNVRAKQILSFDFKRPTNDFGQQTAERSVPVPFINNMNVLVGAEKRWSPIVLQVNALLNTGFKTFPYFNDRTNAGVQVKILYELGAAKKK